jgi:hypothetical protein
MDYFRQCFPSDLDISTIKELAHSLTSLCPYQVPIASIKIRHVHREVGSIVTYYLFWFCLITLRKIKLMLVTWWSQLYLPKQHLRSKVVCQSLTLPNLYSGVLSFLWLSYPLYAWFWCISSTLNFKSFYYKFKYWICYVFQYKFEYWIYKFQQYFMYLFIFI